MPPPPDTACAGSGAAAPHGPSTAAAEASAASAAAAARCRGMGCCAAPAVSAAPSSVHACCSCCWRWGHARGRATARRLEPTAAPRERHATCRGDAPGAWFVGFSAHASRCVRMRATTAAPAARGRTSAGGLLALIKGLRWILPPRTWVHAQQHRQWACTGPPSHLTGFVRAQIAMLMNLSRWDESHRPSNSSVEPAEHTLPTRCAESCTSGRDTSHVPLPLPCACAPAHDPPHLRWHLALPAVVRGGPLGMQTEVEMACTCQG